MLCAVTKWEKAGDGRNRKWCLVVWFPSAQLMYGRSRTTSLQKPLRAGWDDITARKMDLYVTNSILWQAGSWRHERNSINLHLHCDCQGIYRWEALGLFQILCSSLCFLSVLMLSGQLYPVLLVLTCDTAKSVTGLCRGAYGHHSAFSNVAIQSPVPWDCVEDAAPLWNWSYHAMMQWLLTAHFNEAGFSLWSGKGGLFLTRAIGQPKCADWECLVSV